MVKSKNQRGIIVDEPSVGRGRAISRIANQDKAKEKYPKITHPIQMGFPL
jgi:hypothetical protein